MKVEELVRELKKAGVKIDEFKKPNRQNPQPIVPSVWINRSNSSFTPVGQAEIELVCFMQECRNRTSVMKDSEKCERCKLRFRCYTEIKVEKKKKQSTGQIRKGDFSGIRPMILQEKIWKEKVDDIFNCYTKSDTQTKSK